VLKENQKKYNENTINFDRFKRNLGKYISTSKPFNKTKKEAADELKISLSKYMAYEDTNKDYRRQSIPLDLLFHLAKRDRLPIKDLIEKIDQIDHKFLNHNSQDKIILNICEKIRSSSRGSLIEQLYHIINRTRKKFPTNDLINTDPELWIIYMLHNIFV